MNDETVNDDSGDGWTVVELSASETYPLRLSVLRVDTPTKVVAFAEDDMPGTVHLGVRIDDDIVAISTWIPRPFNDEPAVQLRGMATAPHLRGRGAGGILVESGCVRAASIAPLVWARARDTALDFYVRHGFAVTGDGFVDESTGKPHHVIVRHVA
jgi:predicted GNAT family N-acyltransferase